MWYVITKLVVNCKDDVYLIKMVNFKVAVLFIKILTCFISHRTFGNVIYDIVQKYSQLSTSKLRKLEKLSIKLKNADLDITFLSNCKVFNVIPKFLAFNWVSVVVCNFGEGYDYPGIRRNFSNDCDVDHKAIACICKKCTNQYLWECQWLSKNIIVEDVTRTLFVIFQNYL